MTVGRPLGATIFLRKGDSRRVNICSTSEWGRINLWHTDAENVMWSCPDLRLCESPRLVFRERDDIDNGKSFCKFNSGESLILSDISFCQLSHRFLSFAGLRTDLLVHEFLYKGAWLIAHCSSVSFFAGRNGPYNQTSSKSFCQLIDFGLTFGIWFFSWKNLC
jgi:hypothetical protein